MLLMFEKFLSSKYIELNGVFVDTDVSAISTSQPTKISETSVQATRTDICPPDTYLINPFPLFEHVGVNDEVLYGEEVIEDEEEEDMQELVGQDNEDDASDVSDDNVLDANEENVDDHDWIAKETGPSDIPKVAYDKNDPPMHVGATYSSIAEFRIALCQHAIKYEFEYNTEKTDFERLRVYCSAKNRGCQWRLHASALEERKTMQVKVKPCYQVQLNLHQRRSRRGLLKQQQWLYLLLHIVLPWVLEARRKVMRVQLWGPGARNG